MTYTSLFLICWLYTVVYSVFTTWVSIRCKEETVDQYLTRIKPEGFEKYISDGFIASFMLVLFIVPPLCFLMFIASMAQTVAEIRADFKEPVDDEHE